MLHCPWVNSLPLRRDTQLKLKSSSWYQGCCGHRRASEAALSTDEEPKVQWGQKEVKLVTQVLDRQSQDLISVVMSNSDGQVAELLEVRACQIM